MGIVCKNTLIIVAFQCGRGNSLLDSLFFAFTDSKKNAKSNMTKMAIKIMVLKILVLSISFFFNARFIDNC